MKLWQRQRGRTVPAPRSRHAELRKVDPEGLQRVEANAPAVVADHDATEGGHDGAILGVHLKDLDVTVRLRFDERRGMHRNRSLGASTGGAFARNSGAAQAIVELSVIERRHPVVGPGCS